MDSLEPSIPSALTTPELPLAPPRQSNPILPILFGVVVVVILTSVLAGLYYFARLKKEISTAVPTPTPVATPVPSPSLLPSSTPTASASASPVSSKTPTPTPKSSVKPTPTATPTPTPTTSPTPAPATLDLRFGNPSAHVKQTIDEGNGDGRVINREFSSIQVGEFDEIKVAFSPKVTVCFHVVSNQDTEGSKVGYTITENDKVLSEGTMSQYPKLEAGKTYDLCHDTTLALGLHKLQLTVNNTKSLPESLYSNNTARLDYKNIADNIAPNFTLIGPVNEGADGTCLFPQYISDNVTPVANLKIEQKVDNGDWTPYKDSRYCFKGSAGSPHSYAVRISDNRGNKNEQSNNFNLY